MRREDEPEEFAIADLYLQELRTWLSFRDSYEAWIPTLTPAMDLIRYSLQRHTELARA